ncbi:right-handed parallel beta-helix repeat-containing protein [Cellulomonas marina]|uniref:Right handed beta helix region n=1 Tax=Cellulomonas marina TaxID=988821 RepID=A0A1I0X1U3_9CELL|nr:right-handed parallel beta-helix repeat-containing protein [Cellulomonas marina]GIG29383.1 hypothetical protein Cma02nite_19830 [Cellulomonas marina]SFA94871.1 Right handed beta helix region [Cellulomonas marina]
MSRQTTRAVVATAALVVGALLSPAGPAHAHAGEAPDEVTSEVAYPGNTITEPALVADEEARLSEVRTVGSMIRWRDLDVPGPYRLSTGSTYTLVLAKREEPYTLADLLTLAPQTFVREPDGAYLLSENIVIQTGATLDLSAAGPLEVRLASDADRFVSIVNLGGNLLTRGTEAAPVSITSWDRDAGAPDVETADGRAYIRSIGGQVELTGTEFRYLGFWSGRTGGVALTGTDLPVNGTLDAYGRLLRDAVKAQQEATEPGETDAAGAGAAGEEVADPVDPVDGLLPAGELPVPEQDDEDLGYSYVSAKIDDCTFEGNAFGLFVSSANGVDIDRSVISGSLVDGLVMHRFVVNAAVSRTRAVDNAGDGIVLARATTGIVLTEDHSSGNGGSGIVVRGTPLADGPNASGMPVGDYGNNSVSNSVSSDNGRYGIEIVGGRNVDVNANDVIGNDMGIVVREAAHKVTLVGNRLEQNERHAIAVRDGVTGTVLTGNIIAGGPDGIYVRDSAATIQRNTFSEHSLHAVTLVGTVAGTVVSENTMGGRGPSAIDRKRSEGAEIGENDTSGWASTKPFWTVVRNAMQPLTVMWTLLALLLVGTAVAGSRKRRQRGFRHPYESQRRLAELVEPPVRVGVVPSRDLVGAGRHAGDEGQG